MLGLSWFKKNIMVPVPYRLNEKTLRIFATFCDEQTIGRIGFIDVEINNPSKIVNYSQHPVLDIGGSGNFDDSGVVTASIVEQPGELWIYYSGYHRESHVPYAILSGLAISRDNGLTAERRQQAPILPALPGESNTRSGPFVLKESIYRMWYIGDYSSGWKKDSQGKMLPWYILKYIESDDGITWSQTTPAISLNFKDEDDEHGLAKPSIWKEDGVYKMIYSIRTFSKGYRLGYAESADGIEFIRKDDEVGLTVSESGWDSEMVCFASRYQYEDKTYLFYCGNGYGLAGLGYAELEI